MSDVTPFVFHLREIFSQLSETEISLDDQQIFTAGLFLLYGDEIPPVFKRTEMEEILLYCQDIMQTRQFDNLSDFARHFTEKKTALREYLLTMDENKGHSATHIIAEYPIMLPEPSNMSNPATDIVTKVFHKLKGRKRKTRVSVLLPARRRVVS